MLAVTSLLVILLLCGCSRTPAIWTGVFTAEQAGRGRTIYENHCVLCHKSDLSGLQGRIKGTRFMQEWREDNLKNLFIHTKRGMPAENPSSLSDAEYLDVLAYILQENGFPRGRHELRFDTLESILIVGPDGPKPLPEGAVIQTFGCITGDTATGSWMLRNAVAFTRARDLKNLSREELNRLGERRPGSQAVELNTAIFRRFTGRSTFLDNYKGHKVLIRGRLERAEGTPQVMLFGLQEIDSSCP